MAKPRPARVAVGDFEWIAQSEAPTRVRIKRIITRERHGAGLMQGVCVMDPGERTNRWSFARGEDTEPGEHWYGPVEETYFCLRGRLRLEWDEGVVEFGAMDGVYLAPGYHYRLENIGEEQAFFVYHIYPAPQ